VFDDDERRRYAVVRNGEDQYSIWPEELAVPCGWTTIGFAGAKGECLAHIAEVWTDLRPAGARRTAEGRTP
jgi:MbtH protein